MRHHDNHSQDYGRLQVHVFSYTVNENTQSERRTTRRLQTLDVQLNSMRLTQATVSRNLRRDQHEISAPPLVCARSGYLHTICSDVTQTKDFITTTHEISAKLKK